MASEDATVPLSELPTVWNDARLLQHEPFRDLLPMIEDMGGLSTSANWPMFLKASVTKQHREFVKAFIRWCLIAFEPSQGERLETLPKPENFVTDPVFWELFVEVFYRLYKENEEEDKIFELVNNRRTKLGYSTYLVVAYQRHIKRSRVSPHLLSYKGSGPSSLDYYDTESNGSLTNRAKTPEMMMSLSPAEIEAACDAFMKTVPDGEYLLRGYMDCIRQRPTRRAAPPQSRLLGIARKDREQVQKANGVTASRQKWKAKQKNVKCKICQNTDSKDGKSMVEDSHRQDASKNISLETMDTNQMSTFAETDVVGNATKTMGSTNAIQDTITVEQCNDRCELKGQERGASMILSAPPRELRYGKKRKHPICEKDRASASARIPHEGVPSRPVSSVPKKRKKKEQKVSHSLTKSSDGFNKTKQQPVMLAPFLETPDTSCRYSANEIQGAIDTQPITVYPDANESGKDSASPLEVAASSSASSDDTLVEYVVYKNDRSAQNSCQYDGDTGVLKAAEVHDPLEAHFRLKKMAASLNHTQSVLPKPLIPEGRRPLIWAASRQALCETTSWFRCYHGGVYFNDGKAHGYLLGGYSSQRDIFHHDGRLIISHGGGKSLEGSIGQRDQDTSVRSLLYSYRKRHPLVLIADNKYALFPFDMGEMMYVVLGLYWIVNVWAEIDVLEMDGRLDTRVKYKFAFQYCEGQGLPWWLGSSSDLPSDASVEVRPTVISGQSEVLSSEKMHSNTTSRNPASLSSSEETAANTAKHALSCSECGRCSPRIYKQGWICLHPSCPKFFRIDSEEVFSLDYEEDFLKLRPDPSFGQIDLSIPPSSCMPNHSADSIYSIKGWRCSKCGQLCPRERWECWECPQCRIIFPEGVMLPIRDHKEFWHQELNLKDRKVYRIYDSSGITVSMQKWSAPTNRDNGLHYIFKLPNELGQIHLISGNALANRRADELFRQYQEDARDRSFLRRYPLRCHHARGRMLTNYFSHNAGVPYEYAVTTNITDPFDRAPASVNGALQLIKERASMIIHEGADFNEILTAAYMAEQRMSYHTDDEKGLGPVVASLSLGSIAFMHFRLRRTAANPHVDRQLTVILRHGDVLVMQGAAIQKLYEHTAVPVNFRIAATARCIEE